MENEEIKKEDLTNNIETNDATSNRKSIKKYIFVPLFIILIIIGIIFGVYLFNKSKSFDIPLYDFSCNYNAKFNKITCTQIGDVVPAWLDLDDVPLLKYLDGGDSVYTMKLIISKSNRDYIVLNMTDKEFIRDRNRKFIYELKEQTYSDWAKLKNYVRTGNISNWGSIVLYCSENNLKEDICKRMKKNHR